MTPQKNFYGTMKEFLKQEYDGPFSATDILIQHSDGKKEGLVLIERKFPPYGIAIPGGIAEKMTYQENAIKESEEETGLKIIIDSPIYRPFCVFSGINDDPRAHISSITFTARGYGTLKPKEDEDAKWAKVFDDNELVDLIYQEKIWSFQRHRKIVSIYMNDRRKLPEDLKYLIPQSLGDLTK